MNDDTRNTLYPLAARTAAVAAVFSLVVAALLLYDVARRRGRDPSDAVALAAVKSALAAQPGNDELKEQYRVLDLELRNDYFRSRVFTAAGAWLLLGGTAVFLLAAGWAAALRRKLPMPAAVGIPQDTEARWTQIARWGVAVVAVALAGTTVAVSLSASGDLSTAEKAKPPIAAATNQEPKETPTAKPAPQPVADTPPSDEEIHKNWPRFRGPDGSGISPYTNIPETWDVAAGKNVVWKTPVPLGGNSSPVVWGQRVFLTGATEKSRQVFCFDTASGKLVWQREAPGTPASTAEPPKVRVNDVGYASSTAATDGRRVYAIFANGDVAAIDFEGKVAWARSLGIPENSYGHAASLLVYKNLVIVPLDQGNGKDEKSRLLALDASTSKTVWEVRRQVPNSWTTPILVRHAGREQIVTAADPWVIAYSPADGKELWRAKCLKQDVGPSPVFADGIVFTANEFPCATAIRADGSGDVTATHVLWRGEDNLPDTCSPLATAQHLFLVTTSGTLTAYDAKKGKMLWEQDLELNFASSPSLVGKRLYLFGNEGKAVVVEPGAAECKKVSEGNLGEKCFTSPAFQDGRMYIRGEKNLICIGGK